MNSTFQNQTFMVVKFQPNDIVLMDKFTRKLYSYHEKIRNIQHKSDNQIVLKCQTLCTGLIYQKQLTNLAKITKHKINNPAKQYYKEDQLNNTFEPILLSLQNGLIHGAISLENILVDTNGNVRLKDPRICQQYELNNDFQRLGCMILKCALLKESFQFVEQQCTKLGLFNLLNRYSDKFMANLWVLLNCVRQLIPYLSLSQKQPQQGEYKQLIKQMKDLRIRKEQRSSLEVLKCLQQKEQKRIIVIPSLNLKLVKQREREKMGYSAKKQIISNENINMENIKSNKIGEKTINFKCLNKNKKLQIMDNCKNILKKKGKTLDKKIK